MINYIDGDLIKLALNGEFDVITHGCNCFCTMGAGIAPQMAEAFNCNNFSKELPQYKGDINKLGTIDFGSTFIDNNTEHGKRLIAINSYTQYHYGKNHIDGVASPVDYEAITMCMRKINYIFKGKNIGLPKIGCGLAGGDWDIVSKIIEKELKDMKITVVNYKK